MKYEIAYNKETYNLLSSIQHAITKIKNKAVSIAWDWQQFSFSYKDRFGEYPKSKELIGKSQKQDAYAHTKTLGEWVASKTVDVANQEAIDKFTNDIKKIARWEQSIQQYKKDGSFPIRASQIKNIERANAKTYTANLSLLSRTGAKERNCKTQIPVTLRTGNGANVILDRIIDGQYKLCDSRIAKKKNKFYLLVTYQFEKEAIQIDESKVVGVDLGVVNAAYMATNFDDYLRLNIEGGEISSFRSRVEARRNSMLRQLKYCGDGRKGHGRKTLLKPIEKLRDKVENFRKTTNHKYSKTIVEFAEKNGCGVIQMEDLTGISNRDKFLARWSYYELQSFVEYKAKERGIKVRYVSPKYTSQRCSCCGYIAEGNRKEQAKFNCVICGYKANADFNAAKNIADPRIEEKIEQEIRRQERERKNAS